MDLNPGKHSQFSVQGSSVFRKAYMNKGQHHLHGPIHSQTREQDRDATSHPQTWQAAKSHSRVRVEARESVCTHSGTSHQASTTCSTHTPKPASLDKVLWFSQGPRALSYFHFFLEMSPYKTAVWPQSGSTDHCRLFDGTMKPLQGKNWLQLTPETVLVSWDTPKWHRSWGSSELKAVQWETTFWPKCRGNIASSLVMGFSRAPYCQTRMVRRKLTKGLEQSEECLRKTESCKKGDPYDLYPAPLWRVTISQWQQLGEPATDVTGKNFKSGALHKSHHHLPPNPPKSWGATVLTLPGSLWLGLLMRRQLCPPTSFYPFSFSKPLSFSSSLSKLSLPSCRGLDGEL